MTDKKTFANNQIRYALGTSANLGKAKNVTESIRKMIDRFREPTVTRESFAEYQKKTESEKAALKASAGWMLRAPTEKGTRNRRSVLPSRLVTLDFDYATPAFVEEMLAGKVLPGYRLFAHSTRSHTPEKPRLRIVVFLTGTVEAERYGPVSRIIAQLADPDMRYVDKVSFRTAQMMYLPSCSRDMKKHYVFYEQDGDFLDHESVVEDWELVNGDSHDIKNLPRAQGEQELREIAEEAEDPLAKKGPVGDFCRAYSISDLVLGTEDDETPILGHIYEPVEWNDDGTVSRMTYIHGTTANGAVVYEDKWVYSHHGSDPVQEELVNAYDLVRIHLFGKEDKDDDEDRPVSKRGSAKAMTEFLRGNGRYKVQQAESRYDLDSKFDDNDVDFDDDDLDEGEDEDGSIEELIGTPASALSTFDTSAHRARRAEKPPKRWIAKQLDLDQHGKIINTSINVGTILTNDPRTFRKIGYNELLKSAVLLDDIRTKMKLVPDMICRDRKSGDRWQDDMAMRLKAILERSTETGVGYGLRVAENTLKEAVTLAALNNSFHPVKEELLDAKAAWDGESRIETLFIRHLGSPDNAYIREAAVNTLIGSVARVFEPGCKFDFAPIIEGVQGAGKSTFVKVLYGATYFGELHVSLKDERKVAEAMMGKWAMELPELSAMHKSEVNETKAFLTRTDDTARLAYGHNPEYLPRQCVFWGTTNDTDYLRDPTGNRRFWPVVCILEKIDLAAVMHERQQLWGEAMALYEQMRQEQPRGDLDFSLSDEAAVIAYGEQEARRMEDVADNIAERVEAFFDTPITLREYFIEWRTSGIVSEIEIDGLDVNMTWVKRRRMRGTVVLSACARNPDYELMAPNNHNIQNAKKLLISKGWAIGRSRRKYHDENHQRDYTVYMPPGVIGTEVECRGYEICDPPEGVFESGDPHFGDEDVGGAGGGLI